MTLNTSQESAKEFPLGRGHIELINFIDKTAGATDSELLDFIETQDKVERITFWKILNGLVNNGILKKDKKDGTYTINPDFEGISMETRDQSNYFLSNERAALISDIANAGGLNEEEIREKGHDVDVFADLVNDKVLRTTRNHKFVLTDEFLVLPPLSAREGVLLLSIKEEWGLKAFGDEELSEMLGTVDATAASLKKLLPGLIEKGFIIFNKETDLYSLNPKFQSE